MAEKIEDLDLLERLADALVDRHAVPLRALIARDRQAAALDEQLHAAREELYCHITESAVRYDQAVQPLQARNLELVKQLESAALSPAQAAAPPEQERLKYTQCLECRMSLAFVPGHWTHVDAEIDARHRPRPAAPKPAAQAVAGERPMPKCICGHSAAQHEWHDDVSSCCMARVFNAFRVGEGTPCVCTGYIGEAAAPAAAPEQKDSRDSETNAHQYDQHAVGESREQYSRKFKDDGLPACQSLTESGYQCDGHEGHGIPHFQTIGTNIVTWGYEWPAAPFSPPSASQGEGGQLIAELREHLQWKVSHTDLRIKQTDGHLKSFNCGIADCLQSIFESEQWKALAAHPVSSPEKGRDQK